MDFVKRMWGLKLGRERFFVLFLIVFVLTIPSLLYLSKGSNSVFLLLIWIAASIVKIFLTKQRLNDIGRSGWYILIFFFPVANIMLFLYLLFKKGETNAELAINK